MITMDVFEKHYLDLVKFDRFLGMKLKVYEPGRITYTLEIIDNHLSTPDQCHGGVISAMMDSVLGVTALSLAVSNGNLCSTVEYKINYLSTAKPGDVLEGSADVDLSGSTLIYTSGTIKEITTGRVIAKGMGTFLQYSISKKMATLKAAGLSQ
jgi:uncharacterized protein (TIGR00369 family)